MNATAPAFALPSALFSDYSERLGAALSRSE